MGRSGSRMGQVAAVAVMLAGVLLAAPPAVGIARAQGPAGPANTWVPTGAMALARSGQTATLLPDGEVLVAGGGTAAAELYDPSTGTFSPTGSMETARTDATATLLPDGEVLVAGGLSGTVQQKTAELYDPASGTWSPTGSMRVGRSGQTATLLPDGEVLVAGGGCNGTAYGCDAGSYLSNLRSAELYDSATGTWSPTGSMHLPRQYQTATLLPDGEVLVAGGFETCDDDFCTDARSAELYNPAKGRWKLTGSMHAPREQAAAVLLPDGEVLVAGGLNQANFEVTGYSSAELYDPATGSWSVTAPMSRARYGETATLLGDGYVLVAGGTTSTSELYDPTLAVWVPLGPMSTVRTDATATVLGDGEVLVTGGAGPDGNPLATAEIFLAGPGPLVSLSPASLDFGPQQVGTTSGAVSYLVTNVGSTDLAVSGLDVSGEHPADYRATTTCTTAPVRPGGSCIVSVSFAPLATGLRKAVVSVADDAPVSPQGEAVEGYGGGPNTWIPTGSMTAARDSETVTVLPDGDVLVAAGEDGLGRAFSSAELYDPGTGTFTPTGSLSTARAYATATLLGDGDVLVAGGLSSDLTTLASAELYNPATGTWSETGSLLEAGYALASVLLPDGEVLVTGFGDLVGELYDPSTGTWSLTGPMAAEHGFGTLTLLPDGEVLCVGASTVAELYDPSTNTWAETGSLSIGRFRPTATLLPDGEVLVAGGSNNGVSLASAELYDPSTGEWTAAEPMLTPLWGETATLLRSGAVLVAGGCTLECTGALAGAEIYANGYWYYAPEMTVGRLLQAAVLLGDGDVLVAGGDLRYAGRATSAAELYTPALLAVAPGSGPAGQRVTVSGDNFYAGEVVKVRWGSGKVLGSATTSASGSFSLKVTIPASASPGVHVLYAEAETSYATAEATFQVT